MFLESDDKVVNLRSLLLAYTAFEPDFSAVAYLRIRASLLPYIGLYLIIAYYTLYLSVTTDELFEESFISVCILQTRA